tara:strand:- start:776 stop:1585 length:810 start_codon:yes stop_codon:yes gene_type:complete
MREFFIDTANPDAIKNIGQNLEDKIDLSLVKGVTTNPNAFNKIDEKKLDRWLIIANEIADIIFSLRKDNKGEIHIQLPNSKMNANQAINFAQYISDNLPKDKIKIGMKLPPYVDLLTQAGELNKIVLTNVTGVSDHATALKCISYGVNYVSIIPGRMEEVGIQAKDLMSYLFTSNHRDTKIISGSMRTIEQLIWTFQLNTVPTIGEKVFDLIFSNDNFDKVLNIDYDKKFPSEEFSPKVTDESFNLSKDFFYQMDELGSAATEDFENLS